MSVPRAIGLWKFRVELTLVATVAGIGCLGSQDGIDESVVVLTSLDTLITAEGAEIATAVDLELSATGRLYVSDWAADQILSVDPVSGDVTRIGRQGEGPGELARPWALAATEAGILVLDAGNGRIQEFGSDGAPRRSRFASPLVRSGVTFLRPDGHTFVPTRGHGDRLAVELDTLGGEVREIGAPVVAAPPVNDFAAIKAEIAEGVIPDALRNEALVASDDSGRAWVVLQTEGVVRHYDPNGALDWEMALEEPEMAAALDAFFRENREEANPSRFVSLRYVRDIDVLDGELWLLLDTPPEGTAVVVVLSPGGERVRRVEVPGAGGAWLLAVDPDRERLFLSTPYDAQLLAVALR